VLRPLTVAVAAVLAASVLLSAGEAAPAHAFQLGLVSNADGGARAGNVGALGASIVRVEFRIDSPMSKLERVIGRFARHGVAVLPLAGFRGRIPTMAEARNLAAWARAFGPSGSFWRHRSGGQLAIRDIEFGNETNQASQFGGCGFECPAFPQRAHAYALALKAAQEAIAGPLGNPAVGLLAIGDDGGTQSPNWVNAMFQAVPDLGRRIAGWTAHPYGPHWWRMLDRLIAQTAARGAPAVPIFITEIGIASDNGRCLSSNFGWNPCMTYGEAASAMEGELAGIQARYGQRVRNVFIYQAFDQRPPQADSEREHYFGALTSSGVPKGAYTAAIRALLRTLR
jgi:hypothetical protein